MLHWIRWLTAETDPGSRRLICWPATDWLRHFQGRIVLSNRRIGVYEFILKCIIPSSARDVAKRKFQLFGRTPQVPTICSRNSTSRSDPINVNQMNQMNFSMKMVALLRILDSLRFRWIGFLAWKQRREKINSKLRLKSRNRSLQAPFGGWPAIAIRDCYQRL